MTFINFAAYAVGGIALLSLATLALPRHVSVERSAVLDTSAQAVLTLAASNVGYQQFNPYKSQDPNLKIDLYGPEAGVGSGFHFDGSGGKGSQTVAKVTPQMVTYNIDMGAMGQPNQSIAATPMADGTKVTWRVESDLGFNPVFRVFGLFMDGMMGPTFELGLDNLGKAAA